MATVPLDDMFVLHPFAVNYRVESKKTRMEDVDNCINDIFPIFKALILEGLGEDRKRNCTNDDLGAGWKDGYNF